MKRCERRCNYSLRQDRLPVQTVDRQMDCCAWMPKDVEVDIAREAERRSGLVLTTGVNGR